MEKQAKKNRNKIKQGTKIRSVLQQEINSICPFCQSEDVGYFEIHHIDENPEHNIISNLILLCPTCHSKITKGDISQKKVKQVKNKTKLMHKPIECAAISVDSANCSWISYNNLPNAFIEYKSDKSPYPIINFSLINHSPKTILFTSIQLKVKHLYSGLSGIPIPGILKPMAKYRVQLPNDKDLTNYNLENEIVVPGNQAFKFQIELYTYWNDEYYPINGRKVLNFNFIFNNTILISLPKIFLNCKNENEKIRIVQLI